MDVFNPQPKDVFIANGWNAYLEILKRGSRKGWGDSVWLRIHPKDEKQFSNPTRICSMARWPEFVEFIGLEGSELIAAAQRQDGSNG